MRMSACATCHMAHATRCCMQQALPCCVWLRDSVQLHLKLLIIRGQLERGGDGEREGVRVRVRVREGERGREEEECVCKSACQKGKRNAGTGDEPIKRLSSFHSIHLNDTQTHTHTDHTVNSDTHTLPYTHTRTHTKQLPERLFEKRFIFIAQARRCPPSAESAQCQ